MNDIKLLKSIINEEYIEKLIHIEHSKSVTMSEGDANFQIKNLPDDSLVIKTDLFPSKNHQPSHDYFFTDSYGIRRRADYMIVCYSQKLVIFIEIKAVKKNTKRVDSNEVIEQLKGSLCLYEYCKKIGEIFGNHKDFLKELTPKFYSVFIHTQGKTKSRLDNPILQDNSTPESRLSLSINNNEVLHLAQIIGKKIQAT